MFVAEQRPRRFVVEQPVVAHVELGVVLSDFAAVARAVVVRAQIELRKPRLALDVAARAHAERFARAGRAVDAQLDARVPRHGHDQEHPLVPRRRLLFDDHAARTVASPATLLGSSLPAGVGNDSSVGLAPVNRLSPTGAAAAGGCQGDEVADSSTSAAVASIGASGAMAGPHRRRQNAGIWHRWPCTLQRRTALRPSLTSNVQNASLPSQRVYSRSVYLATERKLPDKLPIAPTAIGRFGGHRFPTPAERVLASNCRYRSMPLRYASIARRLATSLPPP